MLLLGVAEQVRGVGDLGLDLLLAVAEVVVGDDGHDDAASVPRTDLEGAAAVVALVLLLPAHPVSLLPVGGLAGVGQPELLLRHPGQVRRQDDAAGVAGPGLRGEGRVVLGEVGVARIAEDALDEVEVRDQTARDDEPGLHPLLAHRAGHLRRHEGAELQGDEARGRLRLVGAVGQDLVDLWRLERAGEEASECGLGDGDLVVRDRQTALGDVEDPGGGPAVVGRVVEHAVDEPVAREQGRGEAVPVEGERELARQARLVEHEGPSREPGALAGVGEVVVEEGLDPPVGSAEPVGQPPAQLPLSREDRTRQPRRLGVLEPLRQGQPQLGQAEVDGSVLGGRHS